MNNNYYFHNPVKFVLGKDCIINYGKFITDYCKKIFIVTGKNSAKISGVLTDFLEVCNQHKLKYIIFNKITENPDISVIREASDIFKQNSCDAVAGLGGGSPIDAAKAISIFAANNFSNKEIYKPDLIKKSFPIFAVPTTSGSGSEVTPYSIVSDSTVRVKAGFGHPLLFPSFSFIDPKYTLSLPYKVTLDTGVDAMSHLLEGIFSNKRNPFLYPIIYKGVKLVYNNLMPLLNNPNDINLRTDISMASLYGGFVIAQTSTTLQHSIGYPLTSRCSLSHGLANGIVLKHILELYYPYIKKEIDDLFNFLNITKTQFYDFIDKLKMEYKICISDNDMDSFLEEVANSRNMANNPFEISKSQIKSIYNQLNNGVKF
jgi:alcohol dehydrogenase